MKSNLAPIALFVYNRLDLTKKTIDALRKNGLSRESSLYIFSDGPKTKKDKGVFEVRKFVRQITGFKKITIIEREKNLGLAKSIISGVTEVLDKNDRIIVIEDDIITSRYFLDFMNKGLSLYFKDKDVFGIAGYIYNLKGDLPDTFFIKCPNCWGWGTWKRAWKFFEEDGSILLNEIKKRKLKREFDFNNSYPYFRMLRGQVKKKNNSWAMRWYGSIFLRGGLFLYPRKSLVQNGGFNGTGTHCNKNNLFFTNKFNGPIKIKKIEKKENKIARQKIENFFRSIRLKRAIGRIRRIFYFLK